MKNNIQATIKLKKYRYPIAVCLLVLAKVWPKNEKAKSLFFRLWAKQFEVIL
jgi:hypothetical protein